MLTLAEIGLWPQTRSSPVLKSPSPGNFFGGLRSFCITSGDPTTPTRTGIRFFGRLPTSHSSTSW